MTPGWPGNEQPRDVYGDYIQQNINGGFAIAKQVNHYYADPTPALPLDLEGALRHLQAELPAAARLLQSASYAAEQETAELIYNTVQSGHEYLVAPCCHLIALRGAWQIEEIIGYLRRMRMDREVHEILYTAARRSPTEVVELLLKLKDENHRIEQDADILAETMAKWPPEKLATALNLLNQKEHSSSNGTAGWYLIGVIVRKRGAAASVADLITSLKTRKQAEIVMSLISYAAVTKLADELAGELKARRLKRELKWLEEYLGKRGFGRLMG